MFHTSEHPNIKAKPGRKGEPWTVEHNCLIKFLNSQTVKEIEKRKLYLILLNYFSPVFHFNTP